MGKKMYDLKPLTTQQKITCLDTEGITRRIYKFAMYGLGLKSLDEFDKPENQYTAEEINSIATEVIEGLDKGKNPTTKG